MANPSWNTTNSDNWNTASDWSTDFVPGSADNVTIAEGDPQITTDVGTVNSLAVTNSGTLDLVSGQVAKLTVAGAAGFGTAGVVTGTVSLNGTFQNGTVTLQFASGQLTSIANGALLDLDGTNSTIEDAGQAGNSALTGLATNAGTLQMEGGASVTTNSALNNTGSVNLDGFGGIAGGSTLNIGGVLTNSGSLGGGNSSTITAKGLINTGTANILGTGTFTISGALNNSNALTFGNSGSGTAVTASAQSLTNSGTLTLYGTGSGSTVFTVAAPAGFGTAGELTGNVNLSGKASIVFTSGQITDIASGAELSLNNGTSVIADASAPTSNSALADLATIEGDLYLRGGSTVTTPGSLTNSGGLYLDDTGGSGGSSLTVTGMLTNSNLVQIGNIYNLTGPTTVTANALSNTGSLEIRSSSSTVLSSLKVNSAAGFGTAGKLTGNVDLNGDASIVFASGQITDIASGAELSLNNGTSVIADTSAPTTNSALTGLATIEGSLYLRGGSTVTTPGSLTNSGTLDLDDTGGSGGSSLTVKGTLTNSNFVQIGNYYNLTGPTTVTANALSNTGSLEIRSSSSTVLSSLKVNSAAGFGTAGKLTGNVDLNGDASIVFTSGQVTDIASGSELTLNNGTSVIADASAPTTNSTLTGLSTIEGSLYLRNGSTVTTTGSLTDSGGLYLDDTGGSGGSSLTVTGTLTNSNLVQIGNYYNLIAPTTVTANALSNTGSLEIRSSSSTVLSTLKVNSAAGFGTAGKLTGNVDLNGDASIVFTSGQVTDIASGSELTLNNATSVIADASAPTTNSALTGLATIEGSLYLRNGSTVTTSGGLTNSGGLYLDDTGGSGGSSLSVTGTLTNSNLVQIGNYYNLTGPTTVTVNALSNSGSLEIRSSSSTVLSTLKVNSAAGFGTAGTLTGNVDLNGDASIVFASGQINDIASGSELTLNNATSVIADASAPTTNSALAGLSTIEGSLYLHGGSTVTTTSNLNNSGGLYLDDTGGSGGSSLTVTGTLTNSNFVQIGNYYNLTGPTTVTVNALSNTGQLEVRSSSSTVLSSLKVNSVAGFGTAGKLTGNVDLNNDASIVFASGQINDIASGSELSLNNATSVIADTSAPTSNSALTGLSTIEGSLYLENGSTVTTSGGLTNSGGLYLDSGSNTGGSSLTVTGTLTNSNLVQVGNYYGLTAPTTATVNALSNSGDIEIRSSTQGVASKLVVKGAASNTGGQIDINAFGAMTTDGFTQGTSGSVSLEIQGQAAGQFATLATTGGVTLNGGTLNVPVNNTSLAAGQTYDLMSFTGGQLSGIFNTLDIANVTGDGTSVSLGNNLYAGIVYGDSAGTLKLVVASATTTAETWTAGTGTWGTAADWSNGAPTFYSDVTIGSASTANVTLTTDATANSLILDASDILTSQTGTDFSIGSTLSLGTGAALTIGGEMFVDGAATNNGSIVAAGTMVDIRGGSSGTGTYTIDSGATLEFGGAESNAVDFAGATALLKLDQPANAAGTLTNLVEGDTIDLVGTSVAGTAVNGNILTVTKGDGSTLTYTLANQQANTAFTTQGDGNGGTDLVLVKTIQSGFTAVTDNPASGDYTIGKTLTLTLTPSVAATVTGTPTLTLNDGATATYDAAKSSATALVFDYTVGSNQNIASLAATSLNLPTGASIKDASGANFNLALSGITQTGPRIDTTPPIVAITSTGGNVSVASQTISGTVDTADAGTLVSVFDNGSTTALGTATVQANGTWSTIVSLATGGNSLVAKDSDAAGNVGTSNSVVYTFGVAPVVTEALSTDSGASSTDTITNADTVTGSGDTNAVVHFTIDGVASATTVTANSSGAYSFTPTGLGDGSHTIIASETNAFGTSSSAPVSFILDTTAPVVAITSSGGNVTTATQTIAGTVTDAHPGATVTLYDNGSTTALGTATVQSNGTWSTSVTLASGQNSIVAKDTDIAGNTGASAAVIYSVGTVPLVTETLATDSGASATDKITNVDTVTGSGVANAVVHFTIDGVAASATATANVAGVYSYTPAGLADGSHTIVASETNSYGTGSSAPLTFTLDTKAPVVTEALTTDSGASATDTITNVDSLNGSGDANAVLHFTIDGSAVPATATASSTGAWSFTPTGLSDATHTIVASETDLAGNTGSATTTFTLDTTAPVVAITSAGGNVTATTETIAGTVTDAHPGATVTLYDNGSTTALGTATVQSNGTWSTSVTLASGQNSIVAKDTDLAGNTGASAAVIYSVGTVPLVTEALATDSGSSSTDKITNVDTVTGSGIANAVVHFTIDGVAASATATANAAGVYSYTPAGLADGSHTIVASETNSYGTGSSAPLTFTLDTKAPVVTEALTTDSGTSATDTITNVDSVSGSGDANAVLHFTIDGSAVPATATASSTGAWSFTPTGLADGSHSIVASETDLAGNTGSATTTFTLDTTAPVVAITSAGGNVTATTETIAGTVTDAHPGATVTLYDNGSTTALGTATVQSNGTWSTSVTLASGQNSIVAKDTDLAGNTGASAAVIYSVGTVPLVTEALATDSGSSSTDKITNVDTVTGSGIANAVVHFTIDGVAASATATANAAGVYSYTPAGLADGSHTIVASETNSYGTGSSAPLTFTLDTKAPVVTEALTTDSGTSATDTITNVDSVNGSGDANAVLHFTIDGSAVPATATASSTGAWSFTPTGLADGSHSIVASETDLAGNTGSATTTFTLDTTAPVVAITSAGGNVTATTETIAGTVTDAHPGATVTLYDNGSTSALGTATVQSNGTWSTSVTLASGQNSIVAKDTDLAGNTGASAAVIYSVGTVPLVTEALATDSGSSSTDKITNVDTVTGSGIANAVVHFTIDGVAASATATANAAGVYSYTPAGLADGSHTIVASETNSYGTGSSAPLTFTLDTKAPVVTEALTTDSGTSATDTITNVDSVSGSGDANAVLHFTIDGSAVPATATASSTGTWSFTPTGLADGSHSIVASETDLAGNTGSATTTFTLDTTAPVVAITSAGGNVTATTEIIAGTVTDAHPGATVTLYDNGSTSALGTATVQSNGTWSTSVTLASGQNSIVAKDTDLAGNTGASAAVIYSVGTVPLVTEALATDSGASATDKITNVDTVTGSGIANAVVHFTIDGVAASATATANAAGVYSYTPAGLADGSHTIVASETNSYGTGSSAPLTFTLDTKAPVVTEALTTDSGTSATDTITNIDSVSGSGDANAVLHFIIDGSAIAATATASATGAWSFTPTGLSDATHTIVASETDLAGNTGSATTTFTLDTTAPVVAITSAGGNVTATTETVAGTVTDAHPDATVTLYDNGSTSALGTATVQSNGTWSTSVTLASGQNSIVAKDTDLAGNTGASAAKVYNLQSGQVPVVTEALTQDTGSSSTDKITKNPAVSGTGDPNATVHFTIDGTAIAATVTASATGAWSFTPVGLADGIHTIVASETNAAGTGTASLTFTLDRTRPIVLSDTDTPSRGNLVTGQTDVITLTMNKAVTVVGAPTLALNDGGTATYDAAKSTATSLVFDYLVPASQATQELAITGIGLPTGTSITDAAGNLANFAAATGDLGVAVNTSVTITGTNTLDIIGPSGETVTFAKGAAGTLILDASADFTGTIAGFLPADTIDLGDLAFGPAASLSYAGNSAGGLLTISDGTTTSKLSLTGNYLASTFQLLDDGNGGISLFDDTPPAVTEALQTDTGASATDKITRDPTLTGSGDADALVTLTENGSVIGTTTANDAGAWTFKPSLADGTQTIVASETNAAGTGTASLAFTLDTKAPVMTEALQADTGSSATDRITNNPAVTGTGDPNAVVQFTLDGKAIAATATADSTGTWTYAPAGLADGQHSIVASETDLAGNTGTTSLTFTLDTKAPVVTEALKTDTGASSTDKITSNATLTGTGDPNAVVHFTVDGTAIAATATASSSGVWTFVPGGLADGQHTIVASETDIAGNTGTASLSLTLDTTPPAVTEALKMDTGASATDKITNNSAVTGTGDPNAVVHFTLDGKAIAATATADSTGAWTYAPSGLADGQHSIIASETDLAGNTGTTSLAFTLDTKAPVVTEALKTDTGASSTDKITSNATVTGTGDPNAVVHFSVDGTAIAATTTANSAGVWTYVPTALADGQHTIVASESDIAGNTGTASLAFILDTTPPAVTEALKADTGASATDKITSNAAVTGTGDPNAVVHFTLDGKAIAATATADSTGAWTYAPSGLADGQHNIVASETDLAGNIGTTSLAFTLDTKAPVVTEALKTDTGASSTDKITSNATLTGTGDPNAVVHFTLDGTAIAATTTASSSGVWTYVPNALADGQHNIVASETDIAGNTGTASLAFILDTTPPQVAITSAGGLVPNATQTISGTGEAGTKVTLMKGTTAIGNAVTVNAQGQWSEQVTLALGSNVLTAQDTDVAGNVGTSAAKTFLYDHAPVITSGGGGSNATYVVNDKTTAITTMTASDADAGDSVSYFLLDAKGNHVTSTGGFSIDATTGALSFANTPTTGTYQVTAGAADSFGTSTTQTLKVDVGSDYAVAGDVGDHGVTDTFVFTGNTPYEQIQNFRATDIFDGDSTDPHGVLALAHSLFNGATAGESGSALTNLIGSHSAQIGSDTLILTDTSNVLDLQNVNRTALLSKASNFAMI